MRQPNERDKPFQWKRYVLSIMFMLHSVIKCVKLNIILRFTPNCAIWNDH